MKQTFKITSPTKPKGIAYKLRQKKNAHPPFQMEKAGRPTKGSWTTIKEGIAMTNLTKKIPHPSSPLEMMGGVIIIINEVQWLCHLH
jgi:hypothetical protein